MTMMREELFANAVCLAPMVRSGTLPLRLLSLRYGADVVYGEEIIDKRITATTRVENDVLNTVDFMSRNGESVVFRTCEEERGKVVFQIGTADAVLALKAAEHVAKDVAAIDINMGCPKHFSVQGGMGAALLRKPDVACDIIKTLRRNLNIPVSCKIRILENTQATIDLAKCFEQAGASAIGVHARQTKERPTDRAHWDEFAPIVSALSVPVVANGDIFNREDLAKLREMSGASSFMIARGAIQNPSIFREEGMLPASDVVVEYLKVAAETDNVYQNTKYGASRMLPGTWEPSTARPDETEPITVPVLAATKNNEQMFALWNLLSYYNQQQDKFRATAKNLAVTFGFSDEQQLEHAYDDAHVLERQFYCRPCNLQLTSDKEMDLHAKGKKHKKKLRGIAGATLSEQIARNAAAQKEAEAKGDGEHANRTEEAQSSSTEPAAKRAKIEYTGGESAASSASKGKEKLCEEAEAAQQDLTA